MRVSATALVAALPVVLAQTFTSCNPTEKSCPADVGLSTSSFTSDFTKGSSAAASWSVADGTTLEYGEDGAVFTIDAATDAPTIATSFYIFFGRVDVTAKAAPGQGIVSSIVLQSDDLDEIDWEFIGGDNGKVQSNFYGKGNTSTYDRVIYHDVATPQNTWHTYSIDWNEERIEFIIDGSTIRTLPYSSPLTVSGQNYPQTPMQIKLGNWAGGASSSEGTVEWAGGEVDFSQGPFKMYVRDVTITNANPACSYTYSDRSGSYESIDVNTSGDSCSADAAPGSSASATGSATRSSTATLAPTSMLSVAPISQSFSSAPTTIEGSAYSTNSASISALNSGFSTSATATGTAPYPTGGANGTDTSVGIGGDSGSGANPSSSSGITPSTGSASSKSVMAVGALLSIAIGLCML